MTMLVLCNAPQDASCAESIRQGLEGEGYTLWRELQSLDLASLTSPHTMESVIVGSAGLVLVWSSHAAHAPEVQKQLLFARRLKKLIVPVILDGTALPQALLTVPSITRVSDCTSIAAALLPLLPSLQQDDPLLRLYEQAASDLIRVRKEAIDQAAQMLQRGEHREEVLALLDYMAQSDLMMGVREKAQDVLEKERNKTMATYPSGQPANIFEATCPNGHVNYYDKHILCKADREALRLRGIKIVKEDTMMLTCSTPTCKVEFIAFVDCEGYR